jgi:hypothetical protein
LKQTKLLLAIAVFATALIHVACDSGETRTPSEASTPMTPLAAAADSSEPPSVTIYKTPTCGCCTKWARHLEAAGMKITLIDMDDVGPIKASNGVPPRLASCHTALVDGYVVEGHVPAEDVLRLLHERPAVTGIAVPGMPIGSPGMEGPNPEHYLVYAFDATGSTSNFASHGP